MAPAAIRSSTPCFLSWSGRRSRFGQRGAATTSLVVGDRDLEHGAGLGPFAVASTHENLLLLQTFMAVVAVTGLLLAAAMAERDAAERPARRRVRAAPDRRGAAAARARCRSHGRLGLERRDRRGRLGRASGGDERALARQLRRHARGVPRPRATRRSPARWRPRSSRPSSGRPTTRSQFRMVGARRRRALGARRAASVLPDAGGRAARMLGVAHRRDRAPAADRRAPRAGRAARRRRSPQGRVPRHARARAPQPAGAAQRRRSISCARESRDRDRFARDGEPAGAASSCASSTICSTCRASRAARSRSSREPVRARRRRSSARSRWCAAARWTRARRRFTVSLPPPPVRLHADPARLAQVIGNLLGNAAKYTPPGGVDLAHGRAARATSVVLRVRDTGAGIAPELAAARLRPLRAGRRVARRARAAGSASASRSCERLVAMHGGRVEARSEGTGSGSEFTVTCRRCPTADAAPPIPTRRPTSRPRAAARADRRGQRRHGGEPRDAPRALGSRGARRVRCRERARHGRARARRRSILSDLGLPGMDGYELARRLRAEPAFGEGRAGRALGIRARRGSAPRARGRLRPSPREAARSRRGSPSCSGESRSTS